MNDRVRNWILAGIGSSYSRGGAQQLEESLQALDVVMKLDDTVPKLEAMFEEASRTAPLDLPLILARYTDIEGFMNLLGRLLFPDTLAQPPEPLWAGDTSTKWTLANYYKQLFHAVPDHNGNDLNLSWACSHLDTVKSQYAHSTSYTDQYVILYQFRNTVGAHKDPEHPADYSGAFSLEKVMEITRASLISELYLCWRFRSQLKDLAEKRGRRQLFDPAAYCRKLLDTLDRPGPGTPLVYLDTHWSDRAAAGQHHYAVSTLLNRPQPRRIKLLGEAGTGKSTALVQAARLLARKRLQPSASETAPVPVLIRLAELSSEGSLKEKIAQQLEIPADQADAFLGTGELFLLLDGFNEILSAPQRQKIAFELDQLERADSCRIFLTDRAVSRASRIALPAAAPYDLYPITNADRATYFQGNCPDPVIRQKLLAALADPENAAFFASLNTPLKLFELVRISQTRGDVPTSDFVHEYVQSVLDRELIQKKDERAEYLPALLEELAMTDREVIPWPQAESCLAECIRRQGYTDIDTRRALELMLATGLLAREGDDGVRFASAELAEYFYSSALLH